MRLIDAYDIDIYVCVSIFGVFFFLFWKVYLDISKSLRMLIYGSK